MIKRKHNEINIKEKKISIEKIKLICFISGFFFHLESERSYQCEVSFCIQNI